MVYVVKKSLGCIFLENNWTADVHLKGSVLCALRYSWVFMSWIFMHAPLDFWSIINPRRWGNKISIAAHLHGTPHSEREKTWAVVRFIALINFWKNKHNFFSFAPGFFIFEQFGALCPEGKQLLVSSAQRKRMKSSVGSLDKWKSLIIQPTSRCTKLNCDFSKLIGSIA